MQIFERYHDLPAPVRGSVLTIGNFDGVHRGHQALLGEVRARAAALERPAGALLFEPHPREFFQPDKPHFKLTALPRKLQLLERFGLDVVFVLPFDAAFAALTAEDFVERVLVAGLSVRHVVIGYDFRFGRKRAGDLRPYGGQVARTVSASPSLPRSAMRVRCSPPRPFAPSSPKVTSPAPPR